MYIIPSVTIYIVKLYKVLYIKVISVTSYIQYNSTLH